MAHRVLCFASGEIDAVSSDALYTLLLALQCRHGLGPARLAELIQVAQDRLEPLLASPGRPLRELAQHFPALSQEALLALHRCTQEDLAQGRGFFAEGRERGIQWSTPGDTPLLFELLAPLEKEAPPLLHYRGNLDLLSRPRAGIAGTQHPSAGGTALAGHCAHAAAELGCVVVTGGAKGVDTAAFEAVLQSGGATILVLPYGLSRTPEALLRHLHPGGPMLLLSECPHDARWSTTAAVMRNRLIAALSQWLCVIESRSPGGATRTAEYAVRLGRPLFYAGGLAEQRFRPTGIGQTIPEIPTAGWFQERIAGGGVGKPHQGDLF
ncbi:MAG: DNA-processing protein DprA [Candidatus Hydrogenedentes bacterium]|nr:DNA-processing protein DprA [Candidatus Hydrogenedentota bacterium]